MTIKMKIRTKGHTTAITTTMTTDMSIVAVEMNITIKIAEGKKVSYLICLIFKNCTLGEAGMLVLLCIGRSNLYV
jgi:hypothetical protein